MDGSLYIHKSPVMVKLPAGCGRYCPPVGKIPGSIYKGAVFRLMNQDRAGQADVPEGNILGRGPNIGKAPECRSFCRRDGSTAAVIGYGWLRGIDIESVLFE